jgi:hypothetical protein
MVWFQAGTKYLSLLQCVQTSSGTHPASYSMNTGGFFLGVKRPLREYDHSPRFAPRLRMSVAVLPFPHMPSWCAHGLLCLSLPSDLFTSGFPAKSLHAFLFSPHVLRALLISIILAMCTNHEAAHYAVSFRLLIYSCLGSVTFLKNIT